MPEMSLKEIRETLKRGAAAPLYLFYGAENYLKELYLSRILDAVLPDKTQRLMNYDRIREGGVLTGFINKCESAPFMAERRLVAVKNSGFFEKASADAEKCAAYAENMPPGVTVVFIEEKADKRLKTYKTFLKAAVCADCKTPPAAELANWAARTAAGLGSPMSRETADYFVCAAPRGMDALSAEIMKLAGYASGAEITKGDIDALTPRTAESRVFELTEALSAGDGARALTLFGDMMALKESPVMVIALIERQFRIMLACKSGGGSGASSALGLPPFAVRSAEKSAGRFSEERLKQALRDCLRLDEAVKSGRLDGEAGAEALIAQYSNFTKR
ncbi:MAG: DNA polymerase III subunit delta [Clostridiales bacterium]|jgi:DNA polymerase-3 subunit delta|nr:DNA polymerase III subunit delta [Clostridiales bacterium]